MGQVTFATCSKVVKSAWAILGEVDWSTMWCLVILTRVNVGSVNNFAAGPLYWFTILLNLLLAGSNQTILWVGLDSIYGMTQQMSLQTLPEKLEIVVATSQLHMASSLLPPTQKFTQAMQTASTLSLHPLALSSCWNSTACICLKAAATVGDPMDPMEIF